MKRILPMRTAIILLLALVYSGCEQKPSSMPEQAPAEKSAPAVETEVTKTVEETPAMDEPAEKAEQTQGRQYDELLFTAQST